MSFAKACCIWWQHELRRSDRWRSANDSGRWDWYQKCWQLVFEKRCKTSPPAAVAYSLGSHKWISLFGPAFSEEFEFTIMAGHAIEAGGIKKIMAGQMAQPVFPVPLEALRSKLIFEDFEAGDSFKIGSNVQVRTALLNHPGRATGYRIEYKGKAVCYITDTEHVPGKPDQDILALIEGADLVIYDCTYTDDEFEDKVGWGHSTWQEGVRLCRAANVRNLVIYHHDPDHEDLFMERLEADARLMWPGAIVARENMRINLL